VYTIKEAFQFSHVGLASALGIMLMLITIVVYLLQKKIINIKG
jgi:raffinose/stachyose/melibiose transport system permease protein